ncbi:MAG: hypothetical protein P8045_16240, partial [Candidatus Thiodiazotropha sp.]
MKMRREPKADSHQSTTGKLNDMPISQRSSACRVKGREKGRVRGECYLVNRLLKKFLVDARQGGNGRKSAVYWRVHEHFEP